MSISAQYKYNTARNLELIVHVLELSFSYIYMQGYIWFANLGNKVSEYNLEEKPLLDANGMASAFHKCLCRPSV